MNTSSPLLPFVKLNLHINHPNLEDCYSEGYEAAMKKIHEEDNPYRVDTAESDQWLEGWWDGFYEDTPLYPFSSHSDKTAKNDLPAANGRLQPPSQHHFLGSFLKITGALIATAVVGYQILDLVA